MNRCKNCEHFHSTDPMTIGESAGICRRYPPAPLVVPVGNSLALQGHFPPVTSETVCGEFKTKTSIIQ